jgi:uncharacterized membrane protein (DUF106 family)
MDGEGERSRTQRRSQPITERCQSERHNSDVATSDEQGGKLEKRTAKQKKKKKEEEENEMKQKKNRKGKLCEERTKRRRRRRNLSLSPFRVIYVTSSVLTHVFTHYRHWCGRRNVKNEEDVYRTTREKEKKSHKKWE